MVSQFNNGLKWSNSQVPGRFLAIWSLHASEAPLAPLAQTGHLEKLFGDDGMDLAGSDEPSDGASSPKQFAKSPTLCEQCCEQVCRSLAALQVAEDAGEHVRGKMGRNNSASTMQCNAM